MPDPIADAIEAANKWQPQYNIFTAIETVDSIEPAKEGPLRRVPLAVKDLIDHKGRTTTAGSAFYREKATETAPAIKRLEDAGATVIGRTGLHEFAYGFSSENPHFGPVRNPWNRETSAGGSSGGSAAAIAAGIVPIAIGTDTGGSVRVPAALCGCYGLKVTYGAIPIEGVFPLVPSIDTVGPLANSVENLETAYRAMSGDTRLATERGSLRLGVPQPWYDDAPMSNGVSDVFTQTVGYLRELGHEVHPINMPDVVPAAPMGYAIAAEVVPIHREFRAQGLPYGEEVGDRLDSADAVTPAQIQVGKAWQQSMRERFTDAFATVDLLITPSVPSMIKWIGNETMEGAHYRKVLSWFSAVVNHALVPALALPLAGSGSPPVSLQVIGPSGSDPALIAFARTLEHSEVVGFTPAKLSPRSGAN